MASKVVDFMGKQCFLTPKQQKGADLGLAGGQEDIEYCRGLKDQGGTTGNKDNWQLFVERPGVWVSICHILKDNKGGHFELLLSECDVPVLRMPGTGNF